ncbi:MAG: acyltransferase family protein [Sphingomonadales bacterium]|nr:acyltransferase family protein [Sphingomonadales bacterium]MBD3772954.1 acyltransferase family protein [Paracoccaceae bacterium]
MNEDARLQVPAQAPGRHYGMDWLRIGAFGLLIFYHIGMFYVPWDWHVKADPVLDWVALPMFLTNNWRLALLFAVSGYASAAIVAKRAGQGPRPQTGPRTGVGAFLRQRSARLLVPLLFAMAVVVPPQPWVELTVKHGYAHGFGWFWLHDYFRFGDLYGIKLPTWQHLWFVAYLWAYTVVLAGLLMLPGRWRAWARATFDRVLGHPAMLLVLPLAWLLLVGLVLFPGREDTHGLLDDGGAHLRYLPVFLFGFALLRAGRVWDAIRRSWRPALVLAMAAYAIVAAIELRYPGNTPAPAALVPVFVAARLANGWWMVVAAIGIADRFWNRDHRWRATLNEAVFPFYMIHQTIIVVVAWWCLRAGMPNGASFPLLVAATVAGCWLFYRIGRAVPGLRLLIGLRGWRVPAPGVAPQAGGMTSPANCGTYRTDAA